jgi:hypothetical protein
VRFLCPPPRISTSNPTWSKIHHTAVSFHLRRQILFTPADEDPTAR